MDKLIDKFGKDIYEYFYYLENLRKSGAVNMAGARPYLMEAYGLDKKQAWEVLMYWMEHYNELSKELHF